MGGLFRVNKNDEFQSLTSQSVWEFFFASFIFSLQTVFISFLLWNFLISAKATLQELQPLRLPFPISIPFSLFFFLGVRDIGESREAHPANFVSPALRPTVVKHRSHRIIIHTRLPSSAISRYYHQRPIHSWGYFFIFFCFFFPFCFLLYSSRETVWFTLRFHTTWSRTVRNSLACCYFCSWKCYTDLTKLHTRATTTDWRSL